MRPSRSAPSIIASAIRSFIEPEGFRYSSLIQSSAPFSGAQRRSRTSGVFPIASRIESTEAMISRGSLVGIDRTKESRERAGDGGDHEERPYLQQHVDDAAAHRQRVLDLRR